jgi:hypothetical protein
MKMKTLSCLSVLSLTCLISLFVPPAQGDYLLLKEVFTESGGHLESSGYLLDYSVGQVVVGRSAGTDHIENAGFLGWPPWRQLVAVQEGISEPLPDIYVLHQNFPNPFNPDTKIGYQLLEADHVSLVIYNISGQEVCRLVDWQQDPGQYVVSWSGVDQMGRPVTSGLYFYQLSCKDFQQVRKMLLLK